MCNDSWDFESIIIDKSINQYFFLNLCPLLKILRLIVLLTQHHDADEVADDSETACDEGEGATDD